MKKFTIKQALINLTIITLVALPMILFVLINYFDLNTIHLGPITIPKLGTVRFEEITFLNSGILSIFKKFANNIYILCTNDGNLLNYTVPYGLFYCLWISIPLIIFGMIKSIKNHFKSPIFTLINSLFITSLLLMFVVDGAINRINIIFIPLTFYLAYGIISLKKFAAIPLIIYLIFFILFEHYYYTDYQDTLNSYMRVGFKEAIKEVTNKEYENLYIDRSIHSAYIFYLLYEEIPTPYYIENVEKSNINGMFQSIDRIDDVYFEIPTSLEKGNVYLLTENTLEENKDKYTNISKFNTQKHHQYIIIY